MSDDRNILDITSVSYGKTCNLGNYNSERYDLTAEVEPNICPGAVIVALKAIIAHRSGDSSLFDAYIRQAEELQDIYPTHPGWLRIAGTDFAKNVCNQAGIF